jgi:hypothetical protein
MEIFCFGMLAGMILGVIVVGFIKVHQIPDELEEDLVPEELVVELRAMRVVTGLSRREKEILEKAADYIEKGIDNDRDKRSGNE